MKITTVAPALPFLSKAQDSIYKERSKSSPDNCLSMSAESISPDQCNNSNCQHSLSGVKKYFTTVIQNAKLDPIDSSIFPVMEESLPALLTDEENEDEFREFLLDAVQ